MIGSEKDVVDWCAILCASQSFDGVCMANAYDVDARSFTSHWLMYVWECACACCSDTCSITLSCGVYTTYMARGIKCKIPLNCITAARFENEFLECFGLLSFRRKTKGLTRLLVQSGDETCLLVYIYLPAVLWAIVFCKMYGFPKALTTLFILRNFCSCSGAVFAVI